jgi:outer membrane biogenesis lipoprotein LolB
MSVQRIFAATLAALLLSACASSPTESPQPNVDTPSPVFDTAPADTTQAVGRGHMFGSGT